ncbi:AAA family ATPase [Pseudarthrobacter sp. J1763]|uniref:AAA family ATPase n=1 Tax=Pseudarthrobacter sp. J1763 TaxID=3420445 RepID=UPI003D2825F8
MSIPVITVGSTEEDLVGGLERLHGPVTVVRRCTELAELIAACQSGLARAAVVAGGSEELTASLIDRLHAVGVAVVALSDVPEERARLSSIGVGVAPLAVEPGVLAERLSEAVRQLSGNSRSRPESGLGGFNSAYADPSDAAVSALDIDQPTPLAEGTGQVIAVWGPAGAPGRTTIAVNMAAELSAEGKSVILIDADSYGASIATMLGLLDESAALAHACRLADQGVLDDAALLRIAMPVVTKGGIMRVLTGITRADRWTELRAAALERVIERCKANAEYVVIDTGFCLEADEELSFDTLAPRRNAATLRSLELADKVFAVGLASPIGVPRLVRALAELEQSVPSAAPLVLMNNVRSALLGRSPETQLRDAWDRFAPASSITAFLPADQAATDAALLSGSVLLEVAPDSDLRRGIAALVCAPVQRKRKSSVFSTTAQRRAKR